MTIHYTSEYIWTFCGFLHIPSIAVLNIHISVSVHMCKLFYRVYIYIRNVPLNLETMSWFSKVVASVQFSRSIVSLWPCEPQYARPPYPSPTPGVHPNPCPLSQWCHPAISSCCPLLLLPSVFPSIRIFSNESALCIRWPKYWNFSFNISPSGYLNYSLSLPAWYTF